MEVSAESSSPPRRGEFRKLENLNDRGGLPNSEQNDEECDATKAS
jgi:hypothetical protein